MNLKFGNNTFTLVLLVVLGLLAAYHASTRPAAVVEQTYVVVNDSSDSIPTKLSPPVSYNVTLLNNRQPIITKDLFRNAKGATAKQAQNINGPSMIRIPSWIPSDQRADSTAVYYLYFANHSGRYIAMAWTELIEGPYTAFNIGRETKMPGVLFFPFPELNIGNGILLKDHIASPDVHVDNENQQIIMYFHAPTPVNRQCTFVAISKTGLDFNNNIEPVILAKPYLRVFEYNSELYGIANIGVLYKAPSLENPWTVPEGFQFQNELWDKGTNPFCDPRFKRFCEPQSKRRGVRRVAVRVIGDRLEIFYTRKEDAPERILLSTIDLRIGNYTTWKLENSVDLPQEIRRPCLDWEGAGFSVVPSTTGTAPFRVNQLRDPFKFVDDDGRSYLLYSGSGEFNIGLASIEVSIESNDSSIIAKPCEDAEPVSAPTAPPSFESGTGSRVCINDPTFLSPTGLKCSDYLKSLRDMNNLCPTFVKGVLVAESCPTLCVRFINCSCKDIPDEVELPDGKKRFCEILKKNGRCDEPTKDGKLVKEFCPLACEFLAERCLPP